MQYYTVYFNYSNVQDLTAVQATSAQQAMQIVQQMLNAHADFADTTVTVTSAVAA